jgi:hypothetical protein
MKYLLLCLFFMSTAIHAATIYIANKSDKPIKAGVWYSDKGAARVTAEVAGLIVDAPFVILSAAGTMGMFVWPPLMTKLASGVPDIRYAVTKEIKPGDWAYLDSGLNNVETINVLPQGANKTEDFPVNIKWWQVLQKFDYRGPGDLKRV